MTLPPPPPEMKAPRVSDLNGLAPGYRARLERGLVVMERRGLDPMVYETGRTSARQRYLYGFGRDYDDGRGIVTHSQDADETWHGFWLASDVISRSLGWNAPPHFWISLESVMEQQGLTSGRDWDRNDATRETFVDSPHVQMGPPMRRSPSPRAIRVLADGGLEAVWREVGAL